ncbi:hypothetical protein [Gordonia caeni]|uniref:Uncharacterized protein n=1 Tax=Gordonia caeni TaxID=1007097 RepID=A0ABP7P4Y2_9ACTN
MFNARIVGVVCGAILLGAAIASWWVSPVVTAALVGAAVVLMSVWQVYRRVKHIPPVSTGTWVTVWVPLIFGALAVIALNGWIYRISADAGGESGETGTLIGLATGVVGMAAAYGYGRLRAQRVQVAEQQYGAAAAPDEDDVAGEQEWFFPTGDPRS